MLLWKADYLIAQLGSLIYSLTAVLLVTSIGMLDEISAQKTGFLFVFRLLSRIFAGKYI